MKRTKNLLPENGRTLQSILDNTSNQVVIFDLKGNYLLVNNAAEKIIGRPGNEIIGKNLREVLPEIAEKVLRDNDEVFKKKELIQVETTLHSKGEERTFIGAKFPLYDKKNKIYGICSMGTDITDKKKAQELLADFNHKLQVEIKNKTKQLEEKIKELNTFIYRISHDLKAPLSSAKGLMNLIKKEVTDKKFQQYIQLLDQTTNKMDNILVSFSEVVKITRKPIEKEHFNLKEFIEEIISNLKNSQDAADIIFTVKSTGNSSWFGSKTLVNSVFQNLIYNSIIYRRNIKNSFVEVKISETESSVIVEVSDNGIGIEEELQPKIFDMFYRASISSKGSGLGLFIVQNALDKIGGEISVKSKLGEGTTFTVSLPK